jgi:hypothetical protein
MEELGHPMQKQLILGSVWEHVSRVKRHIIRSDDVSVGSSPHYEVERFDAVGKISALL